MGTRTLRSRAGGEAAVPLVVSQDTKGSDDEAVDDAIPAPTAKAIPSTRASRTWVRAFPALLLFTVMLLFVLQNLRSAKVSFITLSGTLPLAVALLASMAIGALLVLALGSVRIVQLRKLVRRNHLASGRGQR